MDRIKATGAIGEGSTPSFPAIKYKNYFMEEIIGYRTPYVLFTQSSKPINEGEILYPCRHGKKGAFYADKEASQTTSYSRHLPAEIVEKWEPVYKNFKTTHKMKTQSVSLKGMKEIYNCACEGWQKKIEEMTKPFSDTVLTDAQVQEMFDAATSDQKPVLLKWLKVPAKLIDSITGWQDIVDIYGPVTLPFKSPQTPEEKSVNAMVMGFAIASVFNEGKKLTWENRNEYKYVPYKFFSRGSWSPDCVGGGAALFPVGLAFKSSELCMKAWELFPEVYNDLLMFEK